MTIDLYYFPNSASCRSVQMVAKAVGVELNLKLIDLFNGGQFEPSFLAINPQHTVPTLVDNGLVLVESRAILIYLVEKYGKLDDPLYPRDVQRRATINNRLFFDLATLYDSFALYYYPRFFQGATAFVPENFTKIEQALALLNTYLENSAFVAGDTYTIADVAIVATISSFVHNEGGVQLGKDYPNVTRWFNKCKTVTPRYDINVAGLRGFKKNFEVLKA